jgi:hypothetical protein
MEEQYIEEEYKDIIKQLKVFKNFICESQFRKMFNLSRQLAFVKHFYTSTLSYY